MAIPTVRLTLDGLFSIIRDGEDVGDEPDLIERTVALSIKPNVTPGAVVPVEGDPMGYFPEDLTWEVGPAATANMNWPFTALVPNLADPAMLTDAVSYTVDIMTTDTIPHTRPRSVSSSITLTPEMTGTVVDLMPLLPAAAFEPTSPMVKGDPGPPGITISTEQPTDGTLWVDVSEVPDTALVPTAVGVPDGYVAAVGGSGVEWVNPYRVVAAGRPDQASSTPFTATELNAMAVGTEYVSTDGAGVGAWVWRKRPGVTGWQVVDGDTEWVTVTAAMQGGWTVSGAIQVRRTTEGGGIRGQINGGTGPDVVTLPEWARPPSATPLIMWSSVATNGQVTPAGLVQVTNPSAASRRFGGRWEIMTPWPTTLTT